MFQIKFLLFAVLISTVNVSHVIAEADSGDSPKSLTDLFRPHWSYTAFWAIPSIDKINPRLAIKINLEGKIIGRSRCYEVDRLEQRRIFNPLAKMVNEQLHRVACKSMKLAIKKIDDLPIYEALLPGEEILLRFDFSQGIVSSSKKMFEPIQIEETSESSG
tara:strand:- start:414 stop:896 length:483 start_codon:yes stop_codon:yes gene_type:complete